MKRTSPILQYRKPGGIQVVPGILVPSGLKCTTAVRVGRLDSRDVLAERALVPSITLVSAGVMLFSQKLFNMSHILEQPHSYFALGKQY